LKGIAKGALTPEIADARFDKWLSEKESKIANKVQKLSGSKEEDKRARLAAEKARDEAKAKAIVAKQNAATAQASESAEEAPSEETPAAEA
jgi:small subunit ribosomal protein S16